MRELPPASVAHGSINYLSHLSTPAGSRLRSRPPRPPANSYLNPAFLSLGGVLSPTLLAGLLETHFPTSAPSLPFSQVCPSPPWAAHHSFYKDAENPPAKGSEHFIDHLLPTSVFSEVLGLLKACPSGNVDLLGGSRHLLSQYP